MTTATNLKPETIQALIYGWVVESFLPDTPLSWVIEDIKVSNCFNEDSMLMVRHLQDLVDNRGLNENNTVHDLRMN